MSAHSEIETEPLQVVTPSALEAMEQGQLSALVATAKKWPRNIERSLRKAIEYATRDEETAESCHYVLPARAGSDKPITGPSIRLAEIMVSTWGNVRHATMILGEDGKYVKVQAYCYDCEENHMAAETVARSITTRTGATYSQNLIQVTAAAAASIALRNAILRVIPAAFVKTVGEAAKRKVRESRPLAQRREKILAWLGSKQGVSLERVLATMKRSTVEELDETDVDTLAGYGNSLKEGMAKPEEIFPAWSKPNIPQVASDPAPEVAAAKKELSQAQEKIKAASKKAQQKTPDLTPAQDDIPF